MKGHATLFSSATDEWATPAALWHTLDDEFHFVLDAAANALNAKCPVWLGPGSPVAEDALTADWRAITAPIGAPVVWLNPPYSACRAFMDKAARERLNGVTTVCLVPARTDTRWFHAHVWDASTHKPRTGVEVRLLPGRVRFETSGAATPVPPPTTADEVLSSMLAVPVHTPRAGKHSAPFPSMIVIFRGA